MIFLIFTSIDVLQDVRLKTFILHLKFVYDDVILYGAKTEDDDCGYLIQEKEVLSASSKPDLIAPFL